MSKKKNSFKLWVEGARLRTLPLAIAPVAIGAGAAAAAQAANIGLDLLALAVALFLQIGVNYANDYSDGIRGTDTKRVGPLRLTGSKSVRPEAVKYAAFAFFALAGVAGIAIVLITQIWWLIAVGVAAILAAWFYTGGKRPYGYAGLGELAVFVFFGLVATIGTSFIQVREVNGPELFGGISAGLFASAVLMVNNIRDRELDQHVGKRTLSVMIGRKASIALFLVMVWLPFAFLAMDVVIYPATFFAFAAVFLIAPVTIIVLTAKTPRELILVLKLTSLAALAYGVLLGWGLAAININ